MAVPVLVVLGRCGEHDLVALAAFHQLPDGRCGVLAAFHECHRPVAGGALHEAERLIGRPVGSVRMALGRYEERDLAAYVRARAPTSSSNRGADSVRFATTRTRRDGVSVMDR